MYSILFHILWLSLLEIIFYFEYIGPLETKTYKNTIKRLSHNENNNNYIINPYNTSNIINLNDIDINNNGKKNRENYNYNLYKKALSYWFIFLFVVIFIYFCIFIFKYLKYLENKKRNNIISEIEFSSVRNRTLTEDSNDIYSDNEDSNIENYNKNIKFIDFNNIKKIIIKKVFYYLLLGILIITFEYLLFNYIIIKYKVLSDDEIKYELYKLINPLLSNIFQN